METLALFDCPAGDLIDNVQEDEVLVIVTGSAGCQVGPLTNLRQRAYPSLSERIHHMSLDVGFLSTEGKRPFVFVSWEKESHHPLEQRWLFAKLYRKLEDLTNLRKLVVYFSPEAANVDVVGGEDLFFAGYDAQMEHNTWEAVRYLSAPDTQKAESAASRKIRTQYLSQYRQWINENPDTMTSVLLADMLCKFAKAHGCESRVIDADEAAEMGMNLLVAVGQGSNRSPSKLIILTKNIDAGKPPLLLVGKGVTFDTGGINVKPYEGFVYAMKNDMGGASLAANLFMAMVAGGSQYPLVLAIPTCENLVAQNAMKPGSVIKAYNGKSVVVEHTDAEGRLILADAIAYANEVYKPAQTMVAATLTTAALRQFTNFYTAVHFADQSWSEALTRYGHEWGECFSIWPEFLPFAEGNKTRMAELTNMGRMPESASIGGSSNVAAHFLKEFCPSPMVHFDIFASCWNWSGSYPGVRYGATGAPFNTLLATIKQLYPY